MLNATPLLTLRQVKERYGYRDTGGFMRFVRANAVPFIRLSARVIRFDPVALEAWENKRRVGGAR